MPISPELRQQIIDDLREDRLTFEEIAAKRLGDPKKKGTISQIAKTAQLSRIDRRGHSKKSFVPKVRPDKPKSEEPLETVTFDPQTRLELIDQAITIHRSLLPGIKDTYKMEKWSLALERLLEQRRTEEPPQNDGEQDALDKLISALDAHADVISPEASTSIQGLPQDPSNSDVRIGEKRED